MVFAIIKFAENTRKLSIKKDEDLIQEENKSDNGNKSEDKQED